MARDVIELLMEELEAGSPEEVLQRVRGLKALADRFSDDDLGPVSLTLSVDRATRKYNPIMGPIAGPDDLKLIRGVVTHFLYELLEEQIVEAEVEKRASGLE